MGKDLLEVIHLGVHFIISYSFLHKIKSLKKVDHLWLCLVYGEAKMEVKMAFEKYMEEKYLFGIAHGQKRSIIFRVYVCEYVREISFKIFTKRNVIKH